MTRQFYFAGMGNVRNAAINYNQAKTGFINAYNNGAFSNSIFSGYNGSNAYDNPITNAYADQMKNQTKWNNIGNIFSMIASGLSMGVGIASLFMKKDANSQAANQANSQTNTVDAKQIANVDLNDKKAVQAAIEKLDAAKKTADSELSETQKASTSWPAKITKQEANVETAKKTVTYKTAAVSGAKKSYEKAKQELNSSPNDTNKKTAMDKAKANYEKAQQELKEAEQKLKAEQDNLKAYKNAQKECDKKIPNLRKNLININSQLEKLNGANGEN